MKSLLCLWFAAFATAKVVTYNWATSRLDAAPDGFTRSVVGINGQWPCPPIEAEVGDTIIVNLQNNLDSESCTLHFHGISQKGTPQMDGAASNNQCPIPPGSHFTYTFQVNQAGTYWYHDHSRIYPDGLRGPMIITDPNDPYKDQYDEDLTMYVSDWYHEQSADLIAYQMSTTNTQILPPFPNSSLVNDAQNTQLKVEAGKTYRVRVVSVAAFAPTLIQIDGHSMDIIEVDSIETDIYTTNQIHVSPGQRTSFLLHTKSNSTTNYAILAALDINRDFNAAGAVYPTNTSAFLVYNENSPLPGALVVDSWSGVLDDTDLVPYDHENLLPSPDTTFDIDFEFGFDANGVPRAYFNNITYVNQKVPTLYTELTTGAFATDPEIYGEVNPFIVSYGQTVDIVINNLEPQMHPFHLHGHQFQVVERPASGAGTYSGQGTEAAIPMRRDVVSVNPNSYAVLRFTADNPGAWLFHCHIEWHVAMGMTAVIIEAPLKLQGSIVIPANHIAACVADSLPTAGNAAGNTVNVTDLTGANNDTSDPVSQKRARKPKKHPKMGKVPRSPSKPWEY